jgi:uridine kinase
VGVVGGTGSGKTTVAKRLSEALPRGAAVTLQHDSYYRPHPELSPEERDRLNFDHPAALDNELLAQHLDALRAGQAIEVPQYDFSSHLRTDSTTHVESAPIVIVEGILLFVDEALRERFDIKLYVDTDADIRILRRIERDMKRRSRTFEQVREQYYSTVRPMHLQFVEPSKRWADVIIPEGGHNRVALDLIVSKLEHILAVHPG